MAKSLSGLCTALKKIIHYLKPQLNPLSFLIITGKIGQGKTALLRQSNLMHYPLETDSYANFFYNQQGIILELGESWLNQSENLVAYTLRQLNRCHRAVKITGIILCIDSGELLLTEPIHLAEHCKSHAQLLERFGRGLGYSVDIAFLFTKLDQLAGFCEFFQSDHVSELIKPLGFSLNSAAQHSKIIEHYHLQFEQMMEGLGQQVIGKLHSARSTSRRTLVREFPLQLANLRAPIQSLIKSLPLAIFRLQAIYFTSAEQGGLCIDKLNKKIEHEYALTIQDRFTQATNYRAYFVDGALNAFQKHTQRQILRASPLQKWSMGVISCLAAVALLWLMRQHFHTAKLLDEASKELLTYETLMNQTTNKTAALYHLSIASDQMKRIPTNLLSIAIIEQLKNSMHQSTQHHLRNNFLPDLITQVETILAEPTQTPATRYQALKIYLMLAEPEHYEEEKVRNWFTKQFTKMSAKELSLLKNALKQPFPPITINRQLVSDVRNYLNALPPTYLYYSLAKNHFSQTKQAVKIEGFTLGNTELVNHLTKAGFQAVMPTLETIADELQAENWVLERLDLAKLGALLQEAYCFEYVKWWQNFIRRTRPENYQNYSQAREVAKRFHGNNSLYKLIILIQQNTAPEVTGKFSQVFNQKIAKEFTNFNLISHSTINRLTHTISEFEKFLTTLSLVNDDGHTAFSLTKSRFQGTASDPLSAMYNRASQLPEPIATWAKQLADDTWFILISESKNYLNKQWQQQVYPDYQSAIENRYPLDASQDKEVALAEFDRFFAPHGTLNNFVSNYLKPFLDTSTPQWRPKELNGYVVPISTEITNELIRANVITNMFFVEDSEKSKIDFSLQKINLDPVVADLQLTIGPTSLVDNQNSESFTLFNWPSADAKLNLYSIEGHHFEIAEKGTWAFFKLLQKVNVLVDNSDSASLQILFEINGNSGRYLLKTQNQINPFSPGILTGFNLRKELS